MIYLPIFYIFVQRVREGVNQESRNVRESLPHRTKTRAEYSYQSISHMNKCFWSVGILVRMFVCSGGLFSLPGHNGAVE